MTTKYAIAQRTNVSAFVRNDLPVFDSVDEAAFYIACDLFQGDSLKTFYVTPVKVGA